MAGIAPGLDGYIAAQQLGQQRQQAETGALMQLLQVQNQMEQAAQAREMRPLQMEALRSQIATRNAAEQQAQRQQAAQGALSSLLATGGYQGALAAPTAVASNDAEALRMVQEAEAQGRPMGVNVPNPQNVKALTSMAFPAEFGKAQAAALFPKPEKAGTEIPIIRAMRAAGVPEGSETWNKNLNAFITKQTTTKDSEPAPYFTPIPTAAGVVSFNNRSGAAEPVTVLGQPLIRADSDPILKKRMAQAQSEGTEIGKQTVMAGGRQDALDSVAEAKKMLDKGIYTGAYAQIKRGAVKWTPGVNTDKAAQTEEFLSHIGNIVITRLKEFGGNDSNEEMRYLTRVMGGDITLEEKAIRGILNSAEFKIKRGIDRFNAGQPATTSQPAQPAQPAPSTGIRFLGFENGQSR